MERFFLGAASEDWLDKCPVCRASVEEIRSVARPELNLRESYALLESKPGSLWRALFTSQAELAEAVEAAESGAPSWRAYECRKCGERFEFGVPLPPGVIR